MGILTKRVRGKNERKGERERDRLGIVFHSKTLRQKPPSTLLALSTRGRDLEAEGVLFGGGEGAVTGAMIFLLFFMICAAISFCS